jgi:hypothetical protein
LIGVSANDNAGISSDRRNQNERTYVVVDAGDLRGRVYYAPKQRRVSDEALARCALHAAWQIQLVRVGPSVAWYSSAEIDAAILCSRKRSFVSCPLHTPLCLRSDNIHAKEPLSG